MSQELWDSLSTDELLALDHLLLQKQKKLKRQLFLQIVGLVCASVISCTISVALIRAFG